MNAYKTGLLVIHVLSAIVGIGATFTFGVLGSLQGRVEGPGAGVLFDANEAIEKRLVRPFGLFLVPLSGALMIFARGWNTDFWSHTWLWVAILLYVAVVVIAESMLSPGVRRLRELANRGEAGSTDFMRIVRGQQRLGPVTSILTLVIIVLMVWKPGG